MSFYKGNKKIAGLYVDHDVEHATEEHAGIIEIAKQSEVAEGVIDSKAITPKKLKTITDTKQDVISDLSDIRTNAQTGAELAPQVAVNTQRIEELTISKFPNVVVVGTPHIEGGQVSNFSDSNYLQFPFIDISRGMPFDIYFSFTTSADITTQQNILDSYFGIALAIQNGKGIMALSSNGTNWDIGTSIGTNNLLPNTTYYVKYSWTGTAYSASLSTDDQTYIPDMNLTSSLSPHKTTIFIGGSPNLFGAGSAHPFKGTINFNKSKVVVQDLVVWEGMADVGLASRANVSLNNLDEVGEKRFSDKQNKLIAGENITIDESTNTISAKGGGVIPANVYTRENLKGGDNVTITEVAKEGGIDDHTLACYHFDNDFDNEVVSSPFIPTQYGQFDLTNKKFGVSSISAPSSSVFNVESNVITFEELTIDFWGLFPRFYSTNQLVELAVGYRLFGLERNSKVGFGTDNYNYMISSADVIGDNQFHHYAFVFSRKYMEWFIDGISQGKYDRNGSPVTINEKSFYAYGTYDELRISDTIRYTSNFTPKDYEYTDATQEPTRYQINANVDTSTFATKEYVDNIVGNIEIQLSEI